VYLHQKYIAVHQHHPKPTHFSHYCSQISNLKTFSETSSWVQWSLYCLML